MPRDLSHRIATALERVRDQRSFLQALLIDALGWEVPETAEQIEDISFGWTQEELRAGDLDKALVDGSVSQLQSLRANQPWGIFLLEFKRPDAFTTGRGMTGPLRKVLRGLVPKRRGEADRKTWQREHLLFICTHEYEHFRFAYFKSPPDKKTAAPLAAFGWSEEDPARRTAWEFNLPALAWPDDPADSDAWVRQWAVAFDVEKVTKRFYEEYAAAFTEVEGRIGRASRIKDKDDLRLFTQTLFNRLMFLRFIERKGWLQFPPDRPVGGPVNRRTHAANDYLDALMQAGGIGGKSVYQSRLRPLFFAGLAVEGKQESPAIGKVPFLNGGLFEENDLDEEAKDVPDAALAPMLGQSGSPGLFYRFNFTVEESTPLDIEVAVDPEMLGKVFERLVTGRHETGSYYTPKPIVSFMCREALKHYLATALPGEKAENLSKLVDDHDAAGLKNAEAVLAALRAVKVCDPACGSGAYLLGMLHELLELRTCLFVSKKVDAKTAYERKLEIIENNLYGVDIDTFAVNIARLRLWLSLAVEYEGDQPPPLPNLDFKIEVGDSLAAPDPQRAFAGQGAFRDDLLKQFREQKAAFLEAHGDEKQRLKAQIDDLRSDLATWLRSQAPEGAFDWATEFAEVFAPRPGEMQPGGFDIIVANPPYVSRNTLQEKDPTLASTLRPRYVTMGGRDYDLFGCFIERGVDVLKANGMLAVIVPSGWYSGAGFGALRRFVASRTDPLVFVNLPYDVFGAWVDTTIVVASRRVTPTEWPRSSSCLARLRNFEKREVISTTTDFDRGSIVADIADWFTPSSDVFLTRANATAIGLMRRIEASCRRLGDITDIQRGVTPFKLTDTKTTRSHRRAFAGTVRRYLLQSGPTQFIKFDDTLAEPKPERYFTGPRILLRELISRQFRLQATYAEESFVTNKSMQSILPTSGGPSLKYILACINSSLMSWIFLQRSNVAHRDDFPKIVLKETRALPIADATRKEQLQVARLVDSILAARQSNAEADTRELETELDDIICNLYGVTGEETSLLQGRRE